MLAREWISMLQTQKGYIRYAVYLASGKLIVAAHGIDSCEFDLAE